MDHPPCALGPARLKDADVTVDFQSETTPNDVVTVIATEPLTDNENWTLMQGGEWMLWWRGEIVTQGASERDVKHSRNVDAASGRIPRCLAHHKNERGKECCAAMYAWCCSHWV